MPGAPTLLRNVINYGLAADIPAALIEGRLYYASDEAMWYRDNGTTWDALVTGVSSVDGLTGEVDLSGVYEAIGAASSEVDGHEAASDPHPDYLKAAEADLLYDPLGAAATEAAAEVAAHAAVTEAVHGIADTADLIVEGDARLTDARTPTAHATSHAAAGSDPVTPSAIGADKAGTGIAMAIVFGG